MELQPINDRVLIKQLAAEEVTKGGIVIPELAAEKPAKGKVVAVGPLVEVVKVGDLVIYPAFTGSNVTLDDNSEVLLIKEEELLAIES